MVKLLCSISELKVYDGDSHVTMTLHAMVHKLPQQPHRFAVVRRLVFICIIYMSFLMFICIESSMSILYMYSIGSILYMYSILSWQETFVTIF